MNAIEATPEERAALVTRERLAGKLEVQCPACGQWRPGYCVVKQGDDWRCDADVSQASRDVGAEARRNDLGLARAIRWAEVKRERDRRRTVAETAFGAFDCDEVGKSNLLGQLQAFAVLGQNAPASVTWKLHDNSIAVLTKDEFTQACLACLDHIRAIYERSFQIEAEIAACATIAEVEAVAWDAPPP